MNINRIVPVNTILLDDNYEIPLVCDTIESDKFICRVMDYDGSIIKEEYHASGEIFELPSEFPTHDKLIAQEWVGPVEIVDNKVTVTDRDLLFGVTYTTKSGLSEFDIELTKASDLTIGFNMDGTKDWGDGTVNTSTTHRYASPGKYTITCNGTTVGDASSDEWRGLFGKSLDEVRTFMCDVRIGSNVTKIGESFALCYGLRTITIPNTVREIVSPDYGTFIASEDFAEVVTIPSSVTDLSTATIMAKNVVLPHTLTVMSGVTTRHHTILSFPDSVESIVGALTLPAVDKLILPTNLTSMKNLTIHNIEKLLLSDNIKSVGTITSESLEELRISSVSVVLACPNLRKLTLEEGVESITINESNYRLSELKMPSTIVSVKGTVIYNLMALDALSFEKHAFVPTYTSHHSQWLYYTKERAKIIVPDALYAAWIADANWSKVSNCIYKVSELESNPPSVETTPSGKYVSTSISTDSHSVVDFTITDGVVSSVNTGYSYTDLVPHDVPTLTLSGDTITVEHQYMGGGVVGTTTLTYDAATDSFSGTIYSAGALERVTEIDATFIKE